jgi:hypothetical protein
MSERPSKTSSPSNSPQPNSAQDRPKVIESITSSATSQDFTETPQSTAEQTVSTPVIIVTRSPTSRTPTPEITPRQSRPLSIRHHSQPPRRQRSSTPYERPERSSSNPRETATIITTTTAMSSSSSSSSNTSTAGSSSGSGQSYQLPYAPFPYPMPANPRGGQGK